jgi:peptidoglycan-associated lipoprotein
MQKILATTIAAAVSLMLITGCGGSGENVVQEEAAKKAQQEQQAADAKAAKAKAQPTEQPVTKANGDEVTKAQATAQAVSDAAKAKLSDLTRINFDYDKAQITPAAADILKQDAIIIKGVPGVKITIEGHCDERGTTEYNLALGERRANAVKRFLADTGVEPSRLSTVSKGEEEPIDMGNTEEAWAKNRRAEFKVAK